MTKDKKIIFPDQIPIPKPRIKDKLKVPYGFKCARMTRFRKGCDNENVPGRDCVVHIKGCGFKICGFLLIVPYPEDEIEINPEQDLKEQTS